MRTTLVVGLAVIALALAGCGEKSGNSKGDSSLLSGLGGSPAKEGPAGPMGPQGPAGPPGPAGASLRTATSTSCASNGCPLTCSADEVLVSGLCVGATGVRLSDNMQLDREGALTVRCGSTSTSLILSCAKK